MITIQEKEDGYTRIIKIGGGEGIQDYQEVEVPTMTFNLIKEYFLSKNKIPIQSMSRQVKEKFQEVENNSVKIEGNTIIFPDGKTATIPIGNGESLTENDVKRIIKEEVGEWKLINVASNYSKEPKMKIPEKILTVLRSEERKK